MTSTRISGREFLQLSAGATAGAAIAGSAMGTSCLRRRPGCHTQRLHPSRTRSLDARPYPARATSSPSARPRINSTAPWAPCLCGATTPPIQTTAKPAKTCWLSGPTIVAQKERHDASTSANALPRKHLLNVDPTITQMKGKPLNSRILTHLHGGHIPDTDDGNPYASPDIQTGPTPQTVHYANDQEAAHLLVPRPRLGHHTLERHAGSLASTSLRVRRLGDNGNGGNFPTNLAVRCPAGWTASTILARFRWSYRTGPLPKTVGSSTPPSGRPSSSVTWYASPVQVWPSTSSSSASTAAEDPKRLQLPLLQPGAYW